VETLASGQSQKQLDNPRNFVTVSPIRADAQQRGRKDIFDLSRTADGYSRPTGQMVTWLAASYGYLGPPIAPLAFMRNKDAPPRGSWDENWCQK